MVKRKILIASDSFKGTLTSLEIGRIIKNRLVNKGYDAEYIAVSDGGEGFLDALEASLTNVRRIYTASFDAFLNPNYASFLYDEETGDAYFELAEVVGIAKVKDQLNPYFASTYGLGYLINYAINNYSIKHVYIGIGGSASNDGGSGMLEALGLKFYDQNDKLITKLNNQLLKDINRIDNKELLKKISNIKFTVLTDVTNPLLGSNGAIYVYARQKGASDSDLEVLESNLRHYHKLTTNYFNQDYEDTPGAGAAGGCGFGIIAYLNATFQTGISFIIEKTNLKSNINKYDEVITGEGRFDYQSLYGKVIEGIRKLNPHKLTIICGSKDETKVDGINIYAIVPNISSLDESLNNPKESLIKLIDYYF